MLGAFMPEKSVKPSDYEIASALIKDIGQGDTVSMPRSRLANLLAIAAADGRRTELRQCNEAAKADRRPKLWLAVRMALFLILIGAGCSVLASAYHPAARVTLDAGAVGLGSALLAAAWLLHRYQATAPKE